MHNEISFFASDAFPSRDLAFIAAACDLQMRKHYAPAWGVEPWPVIPVTSNDELPVNPIFFANDLGVPGALGFHSIEGDAAIEVYGRVLIQSFGATAVTASHEALEMKGDPNVDQWIAIPGGYYAGHDVALEVGDPVEGDTYTIDVTIGNETRSVPVSNFVLPAWFGLSNPAGVDGYDYMGRLSAPFSMTPGGYMILRNPDGSTENIFARHAMGGARAHALRKQTDPMSRTGRRHGASLAKAQASVWMPR